MINPSVSIREKGNEQAYEQIAFPSLTLKDGDYIIINSITNKIKYFNGVSIEDGYDLIDPTKDSFIYA